MLLRLTCSLPAIMLTLPSFKGKGYAGAIKRFNASRLKGKATVPACTPPCGFYAGACSDPSKIMKGKMMPGHMALSRLPFRT